MMRTSLTIFAALACLQVSLASPIVAANPNCGPFDHPDDCAALTDLYHATNGTGWKNDGSRRNSKWLSGKTICGGTNTGNWHGVKCVQPSLVPGGKSVDCQHYDGKFCRVGKIDLSSNNLVGTIPDSIGNLKLLDELNLGFNALTGAVPSTLDKSRSLTLLILNNNNLTSWGADICAQLGPGPRVPKGQWLGYCEVKNNNFACPILECLKGSQGQPGWCKATCK
jgi:hypothetical protein